MFGRKTCEACKLLRGQLQRKSAELERVKLELSGVEARLGEARARISEEIARAEAEKEALTDRLIAREGDKTRENMLKMKTDSEPDPSPEELQKLADFMQGAKRRINEIWGLDDGKPPEGTTWFGFGDAPAEEESEESVTADA